MLVRPRCTIHIWDLRWDLENLRSLCSKVCGCFMFSWIDQWIVFCTLCVVAQFEGVLCDLCVLCWLVFVTSLALASVVTKVLCSPVALFFLLFSIVPMKRYVWKLIYYWENWCWLGVQFAQISMLYWRGNIDVWFIIMSSKTSCKNVRWLILVSFSPSLLFFSSIDELLINGTFSKHFFKRGMLWFTSWVVSKQW